jgi:peroxiredoxin
MMTGAIRPGARAPEIELMDLDGRVRRPLTPEPGAAGPLLLVFFKDDCPTSLYTLPFVQRIHRAIAARGARIFGVSQDDPEPARKLARAIGIEFPVLLDGPGFAVSKEYGLTTVPTCFVVGREGEVRRTLAGFRRKDIEEIARDLAEGVGAPAPDVFPAGEKVLESKPG